MMGKSTVIAIVLVVMAISGCTRTTNPLALNTRAPPQPLPSVPSGTVETSQLDPISSDLGSQPDPNLVADAPTLGGEPVNNTGTEPTQTAGIDAPANGAGSKPQTREALLGSWSVPSDNPDCRIMLAFTKWSGGYRAASRRCSSTEIGSIVAWDVKGQQVILVDGGGNTVASLYSSGNERYDGTTNSGKPISFTR